jgi:hypothetical protein
MRAASQKMGGLTYDGPSRMHSASWKHISTFYIFELSAESYYPAQSLTYHPHYTVLRSEIATFDSMLQEHVKRNASAKVHRISMAQNFRDDFLIIINNFGEYPVLKNLLSTIDDSHLLGCIASQTEMDTTRGNCNL